MITETEQYQLISEILGIHLYSGQSLNVTRNGKSQKFYLMLRTHDMGGTDYSFVRWLTWDEADWLAGKVFGGHRYIQDWSDCVKEERKVMEDKNTITYWVKQAYAALAEAAKIADRESTNFHFDLGGTAVTYYPKRPEPPLTKSEALSILKSGRSLSDGEKERIVDAIERGSVANDDDWESSGWESSNEGWMSSSDLC